MEVNIRFEKPSKRSLFRFLTFSVIGAAVALLIIFWPTRIPVAESVLKQADFKIVYPSDMKIVESGKDGFKYQADTKAVVFSVHYQNVKLSVTEQPAPDTLADGSGVYFQSLGLRPTAQFNTKLGPVAIVNFYKTGSLETAGQSGVLAAGKTMVIAGTNGEDKLTNEQWKAFFDGLKQE